MLAQIGLFIIETISGFLIFIFLLRFYAFACKVNLSAIGYQSQFFIYAMSDWAVLPLRRLMPRLARVDLASFFPALFFEVTSAIAASLLLGSSWLFDPIYIAISAVLQLVVHAINGLMGMVIIYAVLGWIQPHSPIHALFAKLCEPFLQPLRQRLPLIGGIDLSAFIALMIFQIALMVSQSMRFHLVSSI